MRRDGTHILRVYLPPRSMERLARLRAAFEASSDSETVRRALEIVETAHSPPIVASGGIITREQVAALRRGPIHFVPNRAKSTTDDPAVEIASAETQGNPPSSAQSAAASPNLSPVLAPVERPAAPPQPALAEDSVIPADEMAIRRERGLLAAFLRLDGRDWRGTGPTPLEPGCMLSAAVLDEFAPQLAALRVKLAQVAADEAAFAKAGYR